jgi:hypothetical protein
LLDVDPDVVAETNDEELERIVTEAVTAWTDTLEFEYKSFVIGIDVEAVRRASREKRERDRADQRFLKTLKEGLEKSCPQFVTENQIFKVISQALEERRRSPELE